MVPKLERDTMSHWLARLPSIRLASFTKRPLPENLDAIPPISDRDAFSAFEPRLAGPI